MSDKMVIEVLLDNKQVKAALQRSQKDLQAFGQSVRKIKGLNLEEAFQSSNTVKAVRKELRNIEKVLDQELKKQLRLVGNNERAKNEIIEQFAKKRVDLNEQAQRKISAIDKSGAGRGGFFAQLRNLSGEAGLGGVSNTLGSMATKMGAFGAAIGGAVMGARALYQWLAKGLEATQQMEKQSRLIQTLFLSEGANRSRELSNSLEDNARQIARYGLELNNIQSAIYNAISSGMTTAQTAGDVMDRIARGAVGLNSNIDSVAQAVGGLSNALGEDLNANVGLVDENLNLLNAIMDKGVIPSSELLARNVAKTAPLFVNLSENSDEAKRALGSFIAVITGQGVAMEEANTLTKAFLNELGNADRLKQLQELGIEGIDFVNRKITDYAQLIESLAQNKQSVSDLFGSQEAVLGMSMLTQATGETFKNMLEQMQATNIEGLYEQKFNLMAETQAVQTRAMEARWNDFGIRAGKAVQPLYDSALKVASWFLGSFETMETTYNLTMDRINKNTLFVDTMKNNRNSALLAANEIEEALSLDNISTSTVETQFENIRGRLNSIYEISPFIADQIQAILDNENMATAEGLDLINQKLQQAADIAKFEMLATDRKSVV
jgi:uncharacterized protein YheU (UPF0270 family)